MGTTTFRIEGAKLARLGGLEDSTYSTRRGRRPAREPDATRLGEASPSLRVVFRRAAIYDKLRDYQKLAGERLDVGQRPSAVFPAEGG